MSSSPSSPGAKARKTGKNRKDRFDPTLLLGHMIEGRYSITSFLGEGGMGCVFAGHSVETGKPVAVKILASRTSSVVNILRFRLECRVASVLRHPHICEVYESGTLADGLPYCVMERLRGETVSARLKAIGTFEPGDVLSIMVQVLGALALSHTAGIVHRDVKPGNIYLTTRPDELPNAKLIDFGLAKVLPRCELSELRDEATTLTLADAIPGTPCYLAPEQITRLSAFDERVDVWACGVTMYEMLTGEKAFRSRTGHGSMRRIIHEDIVPIESVRSDVPRELLDVIERAMAKAPEDRYRNADELRTALLGAWSRHRARGISRAAKLLRGEVPKTEIRRTARSITEILPPPPTKHSRR